MSEKLKFSVRRDQGHGECYYGISVIVEGMSPYASEQEVQRLVDRLNKRGLESASQPGGGEADTVKMPKEPTPEMQRAGSRAQRHRSGTSLRGGSSKAATSMRTAFAYGRSLRNRSCCI